MSDSAGLLPGGEHRSHVVWGAASGVLIAAQRPHRPQLLGIALRQRTCAHRGRGRAGRLQHWPMDRRLLVCSTVRFGAILFEMLCGRKAFRRRHTGECDGSHLGANPATSSSLASHTPSALDRLVRTCLAKHPEERWQTAANLLRQLQQAKDSGVATPRPKRTGIE